MNAVDRYKVSRRNRLLQRMKEASSQQEAARLAVIIYKTYSDRFNADGGPGSGNWGHEGVKGNQRNKTTQEKEADNMKNPRFEDEALGPLAMPDIEKVNCKDCYWREADRLNGQIKGAILGLCTVYKDKPSGILWEYDKCPYYVSEDDVNEAEGNGSE